VYLWTGTGGNGKGLLTLLIKFAFGNYYHPIPITILTKAQDKKDQPCPQLADSRGKRFVQTQEPEADDKLQAGLIKELTGGDEICPRSLYKKPITFKPQFGLFIQMNETPDVTRLDGGVLRRFRVVPFPMQFVDDPKPNTNERQIDTTWKKRICDSEDMRDAFILLLIDTFWTINGSLKPPKQVLLATSDYFDSNNAVKEWLELHYISAADGALPSNELFKAFLSDTGTDARAIGAGKFKSLMKVCGVGNKRAAQGMCFLGIKRKAVVPQ
jgi:P4 family phage/plasmid primase-like protien